jgi:aspartate kinase
MIVMKFGGTSVADAKAITRVIGLVKMRRDKKTIVVVSAISEATNILTEVANLAAKNKLQQCKKILAPFKNRHLKIAKDLIYNKKLLTQTSDKINSYFAELDTTLEGISLIAELSDHCFAKVVSYGELLSSAILHTAMLEHDIKNTLIDARKIIITDDNYQQGTPLLEQMTKIMPSLLNKHLNQGTMVVTQGFIAGTSGGVTTILGREGSDYSASLIGMVMGADEIQIWTDVDGIMTSDPRKIVNTKFIPHLSFREAAELSYFGAKVIHPLTIQPAAKKNIPVRILNSKNLDPRQKGTLITGGAKTKQAKICAIAYQENIKIVNITSHQTSQPNDFLSKVFLLFSAEQIAIKVATISDTNISLVINANKRLDQIMSGLAPFATTSIEEDKALIGIIGKNFNNLGKIAKKIFPVLCNFNVRMMVHGSSNTSLVLIVPKGNLITVVQKLHNEFFGVK